MDERGSWYGQKKTSEYLKARLQAVGIKYTLHTYHNKGKKWDNIIATLPGKKGNDIRFLTVAHYDSKNWNSSEDAPGADDNGSGIAVQLELADIIKHQPFENTIQLIFSSNEEYGHSGSIAFAKELRRRGARVGGIIILDVVGYHNGTAIFSKEPLMLMLDGHSTARKAKMLFKMVYNMILSILYPGKSLKLGVRAQDLHLIPPGYRNNRVKLVGGNMKNSGEETSFWSEGFSAVYLNALHRNPYWHTYRDRLEHLHLDTIQHATWVSYSLLSYWNQNVSQMIITGG